MFIGSFDVLASAPLSGGGVLAAPRRGLPGLAGAIGRGLRRRGRGLGLALAILAAVGAAAWAGHALIEHNRYVAERRAAATEALLRQYGETPVIESWVHLSRTWAAHRAELEPLLAKIRNARNPAELESRLLAWDYVVNRIVEEEGLEVDIGVVLQYYRRVAFCVATGACDGETTAEYLGDDPWRFRNLHYSYLREAFPTEDFDGYLERIAPRPETG